LRLTTASSYIGEAEIAFLDLVVEVGTFEGPVYVVAVVVVVVFVYSLATR
jgi:hypothetical protein